jgi:MFS family permease
MDAQGSKSANLWTGVLVPTVLLILHNAQRLAPVPLFDELRLHLGTNYVGVGNLFGAFLFSYAFFNLAAGTLADRYNNKHLMVLGVSLSFLASVVFAWARSYPLAFFSRFVLGIASSFIYVPTIRYVVTSFREDRRGAVMGLVEVGAGIGMIFSLILLPLFAKAYGLLVAFLILPALSVLVLPGVILGLPSQPPPPRAGSSVGARFRSLGGNKCFWCLLTFFFLIMLCNYCVMGWLPTFLRNHFGYSAVRAGLISTLMTVALTVGSPIAGILSDRFRSRTPVLISGSIMLVFSLFLFLVKPNTALVLGAAVLAGTSMAFTIPVFMVVVGEVFGAIGAGLAISTAAMTGQIASSMSGMVFGYVLQTWQTFTSVWGLAFVFSAASIPFLLAANRMMKKIPNGTPLQSPP